MFKRKYQYLTTIITNSKEGMYLQKVYGSEAVEKQKKNRIKLRNGKVVAIVVISVTMIVCGICAIIYEPSFWADVLLSIFSGLFTGLILLIYSGYNAQLREKYNLKVSQLENVSKEISNLLRQPIFTDCQGGIEKTQITLDVNCRENTTIISQTNDICKFVIKLNGNEDIAWLNRKNKYAKEMYSDLLLYACIMQNRMGTAVVKPSVKSNNEKSIDKQEIYNYITKTSSNLSQYKNTLDRIALQIKQQIINFDKSIL